MKHILQLFLLGAILASSSGLATGDIVHKIPPGYTPVEGEDEKGLWMEMREFEESIGKSALLVRDVELNNYIDEIVCRVANEYCFDFRVYVIRNPGFNASMTATGMMQIWTGLIVRAGSSDEIAAVIGHEIAHYTRLHSIDTLRALKKRMAAGTFFDIALTLSTGYSSPLGQLTAILSVLSFSREHETEADILGTRLIAEANYDPHAAYRVWRDILAEEEAATVKRQKPGIFAKTHPSSDDRAETLESMVNAQYGPPDAEIVADDRFLDILNSRYMLLMEDQLDTNRFGRTEELLERHRQLGVNPSLVRYFYGEMYRQRGLDGDTDKAKNAYLHSIELGDAPADAYNNLGYLYLKAGDIENAQVYFRQYLEINPDASDRAMIEFYLEDTSS
jgi:predicted Zn-dependent protease